MKTKRYTAQITVKMTQDSKDKLEKLSIYSNEPTASFVRTLIDEIINGKTEYALMLAELSRRIS